MKDLNTYLNFDGNTSAAMAFYTKCLDGELQSMPFPDNPGRLMHACIMKNGRAILMASDCMPGSTVVAGNNFTINITCESMEEIQRLFADLGQNGKVTMPLQDQFWGAHFGMLEDQFGIRWMFNFELPKA